jgi:hypothetical protein
MENLFPEFRSKLRLYDNCCDRSGSIVKNKEFYNEYKKEPHNASMRGGKKNNNKETKKIF